MNRLRSAFADPVGRLRLLLLPLGAGYLLAQHGGSPATGADWVLTMIAGTVALFGGRFPLAVAVVQAGLVVAAD